MEGINKSEATFLFYGEAEKKPESKLRAGNKVEEE